MSTHLIICARPNVPLSSGNRIPPSPKEIGNFPIAGYAIRFAEGLIDGPTYTISRSVAEMGNFALGFKDAVEYYGLFNVIDKGKSAMVAPERRYNALKFTIQGGFESEPFYNGYGDKISARNGMRIIGGVTIFTPSGTPWYIDAGIDAGIFIYSESNGQ